MEAVILAVEVVCGKDEFKSLFFIYLFIIFKYNVKKTVY